MRPSASLAFLAGHESFAAAEGAIGIAKTANPRPQGSPLRIILNGLGKDAAYIISRINGFTYVKTDYDFFTGELKVVEEKPFSEGERAAVKCYGAQRRSGRRGHYEGRGAWTFPSPATPPTPPHRFQHLVAGHLQEVGQRERQEVLLRGLWRRATGRTLHLRTTWLPAPLLTA